MKKISYGLQSETFTIDVIDGYAFVRDDQGFVDMEVAESISDALRKTWYDGKEVDQEAFLSRLEDHHLMRELSPEAWSFPKSRKDIRGVGSCVYFIKHPSESTIKVGFTSSLSSRSSHIAAELGIKSSDLVILAYVKTSSPRKTEHMIHAKLHEHKVWGEWFTSAAALAFIRAATGVEV